MVRTVISLTSGVVGWPRPRPAVWADGDRGVRATLAGMADVEADIRAGLAEGAKIYVTLIRRTLTTADGAVDGLVRKAFGSPDRLRDALDLLGEDDQEPRALLTRAIRYAKDPRAPEPPRVEPRPDASRYSGPGASAPPGGHSVEGASD
jgi:hypothetical protein